MNGSFHGSHTYNTATKIPLESLGTNYLEMIIQALSWIRRVKFKLVKSFNDSSNSIKTIICESKNKNIAENFLLSTKNENETLELTVQPIDENVSRVNSILKYTGTRPEMSQKRG